MSKKETLHIYIRCSTDKQIDTSVERQKRGGIKFSEQKGMKHKLWIDGGKSRFGGLENRDKMSELIMDIKLGTVKHVWVEDWSRLTGELTGTLEIEYMILDGLVRVYEGLRGNMEYRPDNTMERTHQYMKTIYGSSVKQDEIRKSIQTKIDLHNQGYWMKGKLPYGFKSVDRILKIDRTKSKWVKKIFDWYVNQKLSIQQIQKELQLLDIKSPEGLDVWSWETIRIVLKDEMYIGKNIYTDRTKDPHHSPFDKDRNKQRFPYEDPSKWEIHMGKGVRIIDDETFYKVKKLLDRGKTRPTKKNYLLHGKLHCECGVDWVGRWYSKYDRPFYHCLNNERKYYRNTLNRSHLHKKNCNRPKRINGEMLDDFVWDNLLSTLRKSSWIKERVKKEILGERYGISSVRKGLNKERKQTKKVLNIFRKNRVQFIKDRYLNKLSDLDYNTILNSIDEKIFDCESMISQLDKKNDLMNQRTKWIDWLEEHHKNVDTYLGITKMKQRRRVIDFYIDDIVVGFDKTTKQHSINIKYKYPIVGDGLIRKGGKLNWDEWGVGYKIKKGENIFSLSSSNFFLTQKNYQTLLNRNALCQISWLVNITPS